MRLERIRPALAGFFTFSFLLLMTSMMMEPPRCLSSDSPYFKDISEESGLDFIHFNGMSGEYYFPEMTGQGCGLLDYDNDGDLDVYLVQGNILGPGKSMADALFPSRDPLPRDRLFRNDLMLEKDGKRKIRFVDVTDEAGLRVTDYGMGVCSADFNNDGWIDIYVTNLGPNRMLYNNGDGTFTDVTEQTKTGDSLWGSSAAAIDYDRDGLLDLYIANYVEFDLVQNKVCYARNSRRDYCGPSSFAPQQDKFYRNTGNGVFEEFTHKILADYQAGSGLGVAVIDANMDDWLDIYVANDGKPNQLWLNREGKFFEDDALFAGVAVNQDGNPEGSMGVARGDFDNDGDEDLLMTHIMGETNTLFVNDGSGLFEDRTIATGLASSTFPFTTFGTGWIDYDNDGWLDLFVVNGAVLVIEELARAGDPYPIHLPNQLFRNEKGKLFIEVTQKAGKDILISEVSRGAAFGDIDNDGDTDILISNNNGRARLLENMTGHKNKWIGFKLEDPKSKRDLLGTKVTVKLKNGQVQTRRTGTDGSYASANDPRVLFGLGDSKSVESVEFVWPDGNKERIMSPQIMQYHTVRQSVAQAKTVLSTGGKKNQEE
jgi:hypothetical protein